ncbi:MAG: hypothetical protein MUE49_07220 [Rhodospirillales bacterium]|jgi:hypothetical protein|nr:hypothetical protein [Rhodospirillales bacterium]
MRKQHDVTSNIKEAIQKILDEALSAHGYRKADTVIVADEDHDGDPVLRIDVHYDERGAPIDPEVLAGLVTRVRERLWDMGEDRFPHIRHLVPETRDFAS